MKPLVPRAAREQLWEQHHCQKSPVWWWPHYSSTSGSLSRDNSVLPACKSLVAGCSHAAARRGGDVGSVVRDARRPSAARLQTWALGEAAPLPAKTNPGDPQEGRDIVLRWR